MPLNLSKLNPPQAEAVQVMDGPVLVLSGAGTGKTTVITWRIAWLIQSGVAPKNILAMTFTNKSAREMKERMLELLPKVKGSDLWVSTFHSFCCRVLRRHIDRLGYELCFAIADRSDQEGLLKQVMIELDLDNGEFGTGYYAGGIGHAKNAMQTPDEFREAAAGGWGDIIAAVYERYQQLLKEMNLVDFDDLLLLTYRLWNQEPQILKEYTDRFHYLLVDEYQDTNTLQAELLRMLAAPRKNLCVVGDDDQAIYGWRGASVRNILDFTDEYPEAKIIRLEQNYRSTSPILDAANHIIQKNPDRHDKHLWCERDGGKPVHVLETVDENHEAKLCGQIVREIARADAVPLSEFAILFRSNFQSRVFEQEFRTANIPYRLVGAHSFFDRREVKDAVAYLRIILNPRDEASLMRILNTPPRGLGEASLTALKTARRDQGVTLLEILANCDDIEQLSRRGLSSIKAFMEAYERAVELFSEPSAELPSKIKEYLDDIGYISGLSQIYKAVEEAASRKENVMELLNAAAAFTERGDAPPTLEGFLDAFALLDDHDTSDDDDQKESVTLTTVHAAKGLEFGVVIGVGMEVGLFPHERSVEEGSLEEERRLFYVALTRAKDQLYLTWSRFRKKYGRTLQRLPSQFLDDLPNDQVVHVTGEELFKPASPDEVAETFRLMKERFS